MRPRQTQSRPPITDFAVARCIAEASVDARKILDISLVHFPEELKSLPHWVLWRYEAVQNNSGEWRITKVPYVAQLDNPQRAGSGCPKQWRSLRVAQTVLKQDWVRKTGGCYDGLGFIFTDSGFTGIDLDHVLRDGSALPTWVEELMGAELHSTYIECSISGTGLHGILGGAFTGAGIKENSKLKARASNFIAKAGSSWSLAGHTTGRHQ